MQLLQRLLILPRGAATGVSVLYLAAAVYVPLAALVWPLGCNGGLCEQRFYGFISGQFSVPGYTLEFILVWSIADLFEGADATFYLSLT